MSSVPPGTYLCAVKDIPDPGAISVEPGGGADIIITRNGNVFRAYENSCPHQGTPLETFPGRFLTRDKQHLLCSTHGARFCIDDGMCISGPCKGKPLNPVQIRLWRRRIVTI
jgi:nitrite reductase/ring-hydroxylating ferredoxin subunit